MQKNALNGPSSSASTTTPAQFNKALETLPLLPIITELGRGAFRVEFTETEKHFVYIFAISFSDLVTKLTKGVNYVARDLERNPNRINKHSIIFHA